MNKPNETAAPVLSARPEHPMDEPVNDHQILNIALVLGLDGSLVYECAEPDRTVDGTFRRLFRRMEDMGLGLDVDQWFELGDVTGIDTLEIAKIYAQVWNPEVAKRIGLGAEKTE